MATPQEQAAVVVQGSPCQVGFPLGRAADPPLLSQLHDLCAPGRHTSV